MPDKERSPQQAAGDEDVDRFRELPSRIRLEDTIAAQETPPKPAVIVTPDDPHRDDLKYPG